MEFAGTVFFTENESFLTFTSLLTKQTAIAHIAYKWIFLSSHTANSAIFHNTSISGVENCFFGTPPVFETHRHQRAKCAYEIGHGA